MTIDAIPTKKYMTEAWARTRESSTQHRILDQPFARRARTFFSFLNLLDEDVDEDIEQLEHRNIYKEIKITIIRESKKNHCLFTKSFFNSKTIAPTLLMQ